MERAPRRTHRDLNAWQEAVALADRMYRTTDGFPRDELFGLTGRLRRACVSVAANIAEGAGRNTTKEYLHFLGVAAGSCAEVDTLMEIARRRGLLENEADLSADLQRCWTLLLALRSAVRRKVKNDDE